MSYDVQLEISGRQALFSRLDVRPVQISYPVPTWSAAKGIFDSIARLTDCYIHPTRVEICAPVQYENFILNYGGPLRKNNLRSSKRGKGGSTQRLHHIICVDVCYRLYGTIMRSGMDVGSKHNERHYLLDKFNRRLEKQIFHSPLCLGLKQFEPSYVGSFRKETQIFLHNEFIPVMLFSPFEDSCYSIPNTQIIKNVYIKDGVLNYDQYTPTNFE